MENVVLLPHLGSATQETREAMGMRMEENIEAFFNGETPPDKLVRISRRRLSGIFVMAA